MFYFIICIIVFTINSIVAQTNNEIIAEIRNGKISGKTFTSIQNKTIYVFLEVPYAQPPVKNLRFKEPLPAKNWTGILNTTENTKICWEARYNQDIDDPRQNEDCLYLNVYSPVLPGSKSSLPVFVYIYGGKFLYGHATHDNIDPQLIVDSGVVAVTLNYRSGPLGFLTTEDGIIPANLGLKDQNFALKWIQENIEFFGGDPSKVVLTGQSSGAICVSHHVMSPRTAGLFRGAIIQSAVAINSFSISHKARLMAYKMGKFLSSTFSETNSSQELLELLLKAPARTITFARVHNLVTENILESGSADLIWRPVIERADIPNAHLIRLPHQSLLNGDFQRIPILIGITSEESLFYAEEISKWGHQMDKSTIFYENTKIKLGFRKYVEKRLKQIYTNGTFQENVGPLFKYLSDYFFSIGIIHVADHHSRFSDTYFYQFSYYGKLNELYEPGHITNIKGLGNVGHAEELPYLIFYPGKAAHFHQYPESDLFISKRMVKLWTNFVKYLNPTPEEDFLFDFRKWPKLAKNNFSYFDINTKIKVIKGFPRAYREWLPIIGNYFQHPLATL